MVRVVAESRDISSNDTTFCPSAQSPHLYRHPNSKGQRVTFNPNIRYNDKRGSHDTLSDWWPGYGLPYGPSRTGHPDSLAEDPPSSRIDQP